MKPASLRCSGASSADKCSFAEAMPAPSWAGCSGPEKIMVLPQVKMRLASSSEGTTMAAPAAANDLDKPSVTSMRS